MNCRITCRCSSNSCRPSRSRKRANCWARPAHILAALAERLRRRQSTYKAVFDALVAIVGGEAPTREIVDELLEEPDPDPMDLEALDAAWEEEEVQFGPGHARGRVPAARRA